MVLYSLVLLPDPFALEVFPIRISYSFSQIAIVCSRVSKRIHPNGWPG